MDGGGVIIGFRAALVYDRITPTLISQLCILHDPRPLFLAHLPIIRESGITYRFCIGCLWKSCKNGLTYPRISTII